MVEEFGVDLKLSGTLHYMEYISISLLLQFQTIGKLDWNYQIKRKPSLISLIFLFLCSFMSHQNNKCESWQDFFEHE